MGQVSLIKLSGVQTDCSSLGGCSWVSAELMEVSEAVPTKFYIMGWISFSGSLKDVVNIMVHYSYLFFLVS